MVNKGRNLMSDKQQECKLYLSDVEYIKDNEYREIWKCNHCGYIDIVIVCRLPTIEMFYPELNPTIDKTGDDGL